MSAAVRNTPLRLTLCVLAPLIVAGVILIAVWPWRTSNCGRPHATLAVCTELEQGINRFSEEYGILPIDVTADTTFDSNSAQGMELLKVLLDQEDPAGIVRNSRGIKFINLREGKFNRCGLIYGADGSTLLGLYDSWGGSYQIRLDGDGDEEIEVQPKAAKSSRLLNGRHAAVWSDGADGVDGVGTVKDDVTTWQEKAEMKKFLVGTFFVLRWLKGRRCVAPASLANTQYPIPLTLLPPPP